MIRTAPDKVLNFSVQTTCLFDSAYWDGAVPLPHLQSILVDFLWQSCQNTCMTQDILCWIEGNPGCEKYQGVQSGQKFVVPLPFSCCVWVKCLNGNQVWSGGGWREESPCPPLGLFVQHQRTCIIPTDARLVSVSNKFVCCMCVWVIGVLLWCSADAWSSWTRITIPTRRLIMSSDVLYDVVSVILDLYACKAVRS